MKRLALASALVAGAMLLAPAHAGAIIQLDRGIAGARIGNTKAEVRTALGQPNRVRNGTNDFGPFTVFSYTGGIRVTFQSGNDVTAVSTKGLGDRTAEASGCARREPRSSSGCRAWTATRSWAPRSASAARASRASASPRPSFATAAWCA